MLSEKAAGLEISDQEFKSLMDDYKNGIYIFKIQEDEIWNMVKIDSAKLKENYSKSKDSFVVKYNNVGTTQWMFQNDKYGTDSALAVTTDANGDVYITGKKNITELSVLVPTGSDNAYVMKLDGYIYLLFPSKIGLITKSSTSGPTLICAVCGRLLGLERRFL